MKITVGETRSCEGIPFVVLRTEQGKRGEARTMVIVERADGHREARTAETVREWPVLAKPLEVVRRMLPIQRAVYFHTAGQSAIDALTVPCDGEAHSTGGDHCPVCLGIAWGRMLRPEPS